MQYDVCVFGLGYVGLTLATAFAHKGLKVIGIEKRLDVVEMTNSGRPHFQEKGLDKVLARVVGSGHLTACTNREKPEIDCKVFIITVGTPLKADGTINLDYIASATREITDYIQDDSLIILRSTIKVGVCRDVVMPLLEESGKRFHIAMCPERTLEGKAMEELFSLPQIIGTDTLEAAARAESLFSHLTNTVIKMSSLEAAEITKLVDNTYRDIRFAFANEVARLCEGYGVNAVEVIEGGKLGYPRTNVALPGPVGGPCLEKDPHILLSSAAEKGLDMEITRASRLVNERQPSETVSVLKVIAESRLPEIGKETSTRLVITLIGMAFKGIPETDDLRGSMAIKIFRELEAVFPKAEIRLFDPVVARGVLAGEFPRASVAVSMSEAVAGSHIAVIANNHPHILDWNVDTLIDLMADGGFIYDYWNHYSRDKSDQNYKSYFAVGNMER